jgi:hypothetical protein
VSVFEETFFSQKWSILIKCPGKKFQKSRSKAYFFSSSFIRRDKQAQKFNFWTSTFEKVSKILIFLSFLAILSIFEAKARPFALKILKSCRIKVVHNEFLQLLKPQL